jgi:type II restriction/modification system DNA methylase subunit YeeA
MQPTITPQDFVNKWRQSQVKERSGYQEHFIDVCHLIGHATPGEEDPSGTRFTFEAGATKQSGGQGWADVWYKDHFALEYKGKHADLDKAYQQLLQYREALLNPPLLIVCDFDRIQINSNFTYTAKRVETITLDDLLIPARLEVLRAAFENPESFRAKVTVEQVTKEAAVEFARLAELLRKYGEDPQRAAHFLIRLLFCMFAEDIGLLPAKLFSQLVQRGQMRPGVFVAQLKELFGKMARGGFFGAEDILYFDGGLFDDDTVLNLDSDSMVILARVCGLDWSSIEPSIFGTLFERGLDPSKRSQLGAHFTSKEDILLIVEPVLMAPLRRKWAEVQAQARELGAERDEAKGSKRGQLQKKLTNLLLDFAHEIASIRVLDPACGSGNFLYVSLRCLLDLEKEVVTLAGDLGISRFAPSVSPAQLYGIEINPYAHELAQMTVWIGYIQWLRENGFGWPSEPILKPLQNIAQMDAILAFDAEGKPVEPEWPEAEVIVGNPPFLGDKKMRTELGDNYVDALRALYAERIPGQSDLVCYWFEKARGMIEAHVCHRAGLLATNSIRNGANRTVLERIKRTGNIFMAWSNREWLLDGAAVNVSMVGFDDGEEQSRQLDGNPVIAVNSDLTSSVDVTAAIPLAENAGICFLGMMKAGPFDLDSEPAKRMLRAPLNPNGRPNADVVKRRLSGQDVTKRPRDTWVIDFGVDTTLEQAAMYELPFEYVRQFVKPIRDETRRESMRRKWWIHGEPRRGLRTAIANLHRCIVTPEVSKYRVFLWMDTTVIPDHKLHVFARDDDYFFGVLHSRIHRIWSLRIGSTLEDRPSYSSSRTFETFPFPWPPGKEPKDDPRVQAIAEAARELVEQRDRWLNPEGASEAESKKRTLTNLYNQRPTWLDLAHKRLDVAVFDAYSWPHDLSDEDILSRLLALNLERAKANGAEQEAQHTEEDDEE